MEADNIKDELTETQLILSEAWSKANSKDYQATFEKIDAACNKLQTLANELARKIKTEG